MDVDEKEFFKMEFQKPQYNEIIRKAGTFIRIDQIELGSLDISIDREPSQESFSVMASPMIYVVLSIGKLL